MNAVSAAFERFARPNRETAAKRRERLQDNASH